MREKTLRNCVIFLAGCLCFLTGFIGIRTYQYVSFIHTPKTIHVFFEPYATTPALMEMLAFVKSDKNAPKIIAWHRMPNIKEKIDLTEFNALEVDIPQKEGHAHTAFKNLIIKLNRYLEDHPHIRYVELHTNMHHIKTMLIPFLNKFPKLTVSHIHFYEDGLGNVAGTSYDYYTNLRYPKDDSLLNEMINWRHSYPKKELKNDLAYTSFQMIYPVTYHLGHADIIKNDPKFKSFTEHILKYGDIKNINFQQIEDNLTKEQKETFFKMVDFDYKKWKKRTKNKYIFVYTLGFVFGNENRIKAQGILLDNLMKKLPKNTVCYYKEHPSMDAESAQRVLKEASAKCKALPKSLPFETLLMADPAPNAVAGYSSSLFYSVPPHQIIGYITRSQNDRYTKRLKEMKILNEANIFHVWDILNNE